MLTTYFLSKHQAQVDRAASMLEQLKQSHLSQPAQADSPKPTKKQVPEENKDIDCIQESECKSENEQQLSGFIELRDADISSSD